MVCAICKIRRPRRFCPGVNGDICSLCCGTEREVTVSCPFDCPHLRDARKHDRPVPLAEDQVPNREIQVSEEFLQQHEALLTAMGQALVTAGLTTPGTIDFDVREALTALVRTYRTLSSGLYYESVPENPVAAAIFRLLQSGIAAFRAEETERLGLASTRDSDVLTILVFFERLELDRNNGRRRGRAFLDFLRGIYPSSSGGSETDVSSSSLLVG